MTKPRKTRPDTCARLAQDPSTARPSAAFARKEVSILSPLRYPGAKRRLASYIAEVLRLNSYRPKLFVEPFAGGASVALQLLNDNAVERVALGELDPHVASFWKVVFEDPEWLIHKVETIDVSIATWDRFRCGTYTTDRWRALACLFLNRTSFSGILSSTAGPIGGRGQESPYSIDCRFPVKTLTKRIRQAHELRDRVAFVKNADYRETILETEGLPYEAGDVCYYLDPPFYKKADRLYRHYFNEADHKALHDLLTTVKHQYILSYDPADAIVKLYSHNGNGPKRVDLLYSASKTPKLERAEEVLVTSLEAGPKETRLWRSNAEWRPKSHSKK